MQKTLIEILIFFCLCQFAVIPHGSTSDHFTELKLKYPYGLLNDDHGVLTVNDLALNACHVKPAPFVPGSLNPYEYWLCFESKSVTASCEDQNFSNEDGHVGRVAINAKDHPFTYRLAESRPWPIRDCRGFAKTLKSLMRGTSHACISASYIGKEEINGRGQAERIGIFHRLKTQKGCEGEECVLTKKAWREDCPDLKSWAQN